MNRWLGWCWAAGLAGVVQAGAAAPLVLDWGVVDTSSAERQAASRTLRSAAAPEMVQALGAQGLVPWLVQFDDVVREEWRAALEAAGARVKGYMPENAYLIEAAPERMAAIGALEHVAWVGEFLPEYKRAGKVRAKLARVKAAEEADAASAYRVLLFSGDDCAAVVQRIEALTGTAVAAAAGEILRTDLTAAQVEEVTGWGEVQWVEPYARPRLWNNVAVRTDMMNVSNVWTDAELGLTGAGQIVAVADTGLDTGNTNTLHADFTNRVTGYGWTNGSYSSAYTWADYDSHGTHVAGSVLGNGTKSSGLYKGAAYEAHLVMQGMCADLSGLNNLVPVLRQAYTNGARIHSDSWGYGDAGYYNSDSRLVDQFVWSNRTMLIVIAAGNDGADTNSMNGVIDPGSVASPSTAKNCLTVGASESYRTSGGYSTDTWGSGSWTSYYPRAPISNDYISRPFSNSIQGIAGFSGRGPCNDGRIKPDIVAPGTDIISTRSTRATDTGWGTVSGNTNYLYMGGTSMATPLTSGAAALARQWLMEKAGITNPSAALLKALLINGARDMTPGQYGTGSYQEITARPDRSQGFGHIDLYRTLKPATNLFLDLYDTNSLTTGQTNTFALTVTTTSTNRFILTMTYADYWGTAGSGKQLVNDLDLTVVSPSGATNFPNGLSKVDATNNVEMVEFAASETGTYTVRVAGRSVGSGGSQPYALVIRGPKADETPSVPVFGANPGPVAATVGEMADFTVTATGYPVPALALQSTTASSGYGFTAGTGVLAYTPPLADVGTQTFTFTASNTEGVATQTVSVVVSEGPPAAPASVWASATNATDFTAAWSAASGATGYRLDVATNATFSGGSSEGTSRTNDCANAGGGSTSSYLTRIWTNNGSVVWTAYKARTDQTVNGNPSICLKNESGAYLISENLPNGMGSLRFDVQQMFSGSGGQLTVFVNGAQVDTFAYDTTVQTAVVANINVAGVASLVISNNTAARPAINNVVWTDYAAGAPAYVPGYSNRTVAGTSQGVTGLVAETAYHFRVRAVNGSGTSANSTTASVTTLEGAAPGTPPVVDPIPRQLVAVGDMLEYTATATEADGDAVTFACTSGVDEATWAVDTNGYFLFNPTTNEIGTAVFAFTAADKDGTSSPVAMTVTVNSAAATNAFQEWLEEQWQDPGSTNFSEDADYDGDGATTHDEYVADTDPASSNSVLKLSGDYFIASEVGEDTGQIRFTFPASTGRFYQLEYCTDLTNYIVDATNVGWGAPGPQGTMTITNDTTGTWYGVIRALLQAP